MVQYCSVYGCSKVSTDGDVSMFKFPTEKRLKKAWEIRTKRKNFIASNFSCICSNHFTQDDYVHYRTKKILKSGVVPSKFCCIADGSKARRTLVRKVEESEETESAPEVAQLVHGPTTKASQTEFSNASCPQFGIEFIKSHQNKALIKFYTGFKTVQLFYDVLELVVPGRNRAHIKYYDARNRSDYSSGESVMNGENECQPTENRSFMCNLHKLTVEDEFFLVLVRLRLGLLYEDLAVRFSISAFSVHRIFYTWINLLYLRLGGIKCFPHRDIIMQSMLEGFKAEYPRTVIIIDCTEIKVQTPSSLHRQSQTFSNYKSTNTLKGLIGVDCRGGIMFVSQLYTGSISDKELCKRSGFFELLKLKIKNGELLEGDSVMADRGFKIEEELHEIGVELNIPPFLNGMHQLSEADVVKTCTIARHRIHVERAIGKVRNFHIFDRRIPINTMGIINQIWLVCCMLSNFHDPILS